MAERSRIESYLQLELAQKSRQRAPITSHTTTVACLPAWSYLWTSHSRLSRLENPSCSCWASTWPHAPTHPPPPRRRRRMCTEGVPLPLTSTTLSAHREEKANSYTGIVDWDIERGLISRSALIRHSPLPTPFVLRDKFRSQPL